MLPALYPPKIALTRFQLKIPISPQFNAPIKTIINAIMLRTIKIIFPSLLLVLTKNLFLYFKCLTKKNLCAKITNSCGYGGIGRRARLRIWWATVGVRVPLSAPNKTSRKVCFFVCGKTARFCEQGEQGARTKR